MLNEMQEQKREQTNTDLITALQIEPGSRELSDQMLMALGRNLGKRVWDASYNYIGSEHGIKLGDPSQSIDDALALWRYGYDISVFEQPDHTWSTSIELDTLTDTHTQLDRFITQKEARRATPRAACIAILKAKEAE